MYCSKLMDYNGFHNVYNLPLSVCMCIRGICVFLIHVGCQDT